MSSELARLWALLSVLSLACNEGECTEPSTLPEGRSFEGGAALDDCPGHPVHRNFAEACEGVLPQIRVTVTDGTRPIPNALVYPFYESLKKYKLDPDRFPEVNGTEQAIGYDACTDEEGVAVICGFDPADAIKGATQLRVVKAGYSFYASPKIVVTSTVYERPVRLTPMNVEDDRILVMSCEPQHREPTLLQRAGVGFTMAPIGTVVDQLDDFDTLLIGFACNKHESFNELLVRERNERLLEWVRGGGLLFFAQQNDSKWSRRTGCACQARACPEYQFEILPENEKCNDYEAAIVAKDDPLVSGVPSWEAWSYREQVVPGDPNDPRRSFVCLDCIDGSELGDRWEILLTVRPIASEEKPKSSCPGDYDESGKHVALMRAQFGEGMIVVAHHAWEQGSEGETLDLTYSDPNGIAARAAVISLLKSWGR
jgi:hypothetical protein